MFTASRIHEILVSNLPNCVAKVVNPGDDGQHFAAEVTSSAFDGKRLVQQHQLVYGALGDHMREDIHALELKTYTTDKWPHN